MDVLDKGFVNILRICGTDACIVDAARVSTGTTTGDEDRDKKLLRYLYENKHTTPFEMVEVVMHVKCPIFVARQWMRHRTWSYNEASQRYKESPLDFYVPAVVRRQSKSNAQSSEGVVGWADYEDFFEEVYAYLSSEYHYLIDTGVCREQARMVLPLGTYTEFIGKVDLHNLLHFLRLRLHSHAQWEIQEYARAIVDGITPFLPWTMELFGEGA